MENAETEKMEQLALLHRKIRAKVIKELYEIVYGSKPAILTPNERLEFLRLLLDGTKE